MSKLQIGLIAVIVLGGVAAALLVQRGNQNRFVRNQSTLRKQQDQLAELKTEQQRLASQLNGAGSTRSNSAALELARLKAEAETIRKQTNELASQPERPGAAKGSAARQQPRSQEYYAQLHQRAGSKPMEARALAEAMRFYALDHQGQPPASLDLLALHLRRQGISLTGTNQFEIVYHGSLEALSKVPRSAIAVIRDRQTFLAPSGKPARLYGMADGTGLVVESDDDFKSWEAEHVVPSR